MVVLRSRECKPMFFKCIGELYVPLSRSLSKAPSVAGVSNAVHCSCQPIVTRKVWMPASPTKRDKNCIMMMPAMDSRNVAFSASKKF